MTRDEALESLKNLGKKMSPTQEKMVLGLINLVFLWVKSANWPGRSNRTMSWVWHFERPGI